jgi:hypothetical protein
MSPPRDVLTIVSRPNHETTAFILQTGRCRARSRRRWASTFHEHSPRSVDGRRGQPTGHPPALRRGSCSGVGQASGLPVHGASGSVNLVAPELRARRPAHRQTGGLPLEFGHSARQRRAAGHRGSAPPRAVSIRAESPQCDSLGRSESASGGPGNPPPILPRALT